MDKSLYVAMTGASATLRAQSALSQNIANISTSGFKALLTQTDAYKVDGYGMPTRTDAVPGSEDFDHRAGPLMTTGNELDVALQEGHWLAVQDDQGGEAYTRFGELEVSANGVLMTKSGRPLLGQDGPLTVPPFDKLTIGNDGTVSIVPQGQSAQTLAQVGRIRVVNDDGATFKRGLDGLMRREDGQAATPSAGDVLMTGVIEGSNVNAAQSLVDMIALSRSFEMQVRSIKTADENARASASLLRLS
ncbi:MAG: flagellar basal body rod protein FlgF [Lysobacteraceae bacterium]|nr:flagellar basal body rod protein FlgF [Xanthomonadales bacterium]